MIKKSLAFGLSGFASLAMATAVSAETFIPAPETTPEAGTTYNSECGATVLQVSADLDDLNASITAAAARLDPEFVEANTLGYGQLNGLMQNHWSGDISIRNQLIENMGAVCAPEPVGDEDKSVELAALDRCVSAIRVEVERIETNITLFENVIDPTDSIYLDIAARTLIQTFAESYDLLFEGCGDQPAEEDANQVIEGDSFDPG